MLLPWRCYFLGAYIPNVRAWTAGIFTVLITLGAERPESAALMAVILLLANGILQQISSRSPTEPRWVSTHSRS